MPEFKVELDVRNEICPQPVMKTKKILKEMSSGEVLHVMATDPTSEHDIEVLLGALRDSLIESSFENGVYHFYIEKI